MGWFYVIFWGVYAVYTIHLRRAPFCRNMILHYSITMALVLYTFYIMVFYGVSFIRHLSTQRIAGNFIFYVPVLIYAVFLLIWNKNNGSRNMYFYDVNDYSRRYTNEMRSLPVSSTVACGDESFYFFYLGRKFQNKFSRCPTYQEDYFIRHFDDSLPMEVRINYDMVKNWEDQYELYQRKK